MAVVKTYLGAIKPVGEKILLNYVQPATTAANDEFDFYLDAGYCVTGIDLTKTVITGAGPANVLTASVSRISSTFAVTLIGKCSLSGATLLAVGSKNTAGVPLTGVAVGTGAGATYLDPTVTVTANAAIAGTTNSKQRIRISIVSDITTVAFAPSCFVEVQLAKINSLVTQGTAGSLNGIQTSELLTPPTV